MKGEIVFEVAFRELIKMEGGYVNHPADPGGETNYGISKRSYPNEDIKNLSIERAKEIYRRDFWRAARLDEVDNARIAIEIFDTAVNMGVAAAVRIAQEALNLMGEALAVDGVMGPMTLAALNKWGRKDPEALFRLLNGLQFVRYLEIVRTRPSSAVFLRGWVKRVQDYKVEGV